MPAKLAATLKRLAEDRRGNTAVQFAFVAPAVCLFLFGIIETGQAMWLQNLLNYSVAEAARCASINTSTCGTAAQIQSYAVSESGNSFSTSVFSVSTPSCGNQVSGSYPMTLNLVTMSLPVTLTAQACFPS
jgi:Flp pilus assembly protein TadG